MITANVTISMIRMLRSLAICWSAISAEPPVTYTLMPGGGGSPSTILLTCLHGLVGQRLAHVAGEIHLHVCGFAVGALRAGRRQRIAPEVLNVLDVFGVGFEFVDELVVEPVRLGAERLVALEEDHHRTVGLVLLEDFADALHRDHRRRFGRAHRHRPHLADHFELRHGDVQQGDDARSSRR